MREWEQATWRSGKTESSVIERVGELVARRARGLTRRGDSILILAGKGHNGDDARCAAPHLARRDVVLLSVADPAGALDEVRAALAARPALVIDGLFGIGLNRPLSEDWRTLIETVNAAGCRVLAVDCPSGLHADTGQSMGAALRATVTLTLAGPKRGLTARDAAPHVGRLEVEPDIGLACCPVAGDLLWVLPRDFAGFPPARAADSHKGVYGHLAIVAGSRGYHGAAVLAARGAQRAQPGLITVWTAPEAYAPVAGQLQAVMVRDWRDDDRWPETVSAVLIGPGLANETLPEGMRDRAVALWRNANVPVIADASALDWLPKGAFVEGAIRAITPHPGEAARMLGIAPAEVQSDRPAALRRLSEAYGDCWVVLKGWLTLTGRGVGAIRMNSSGNPGLAQGGSGDLLAGYLGGLLAQPALRGEVDRTLSCAVWQHGAAADRLARRRKNWTVEDLAAMLGRC